MIVVLGLVSAVAFSSSYQLVARFANKSVIALGLGCVGSGIVVLLLELAIGMKTRPTQAQLIWLFELTAGALLSHPPLAVLASLFSCRGPAMHARTPRAAEAFTMRADPDGA